MSVRLVLYAEGGAETGGELGLPPPPGDALFGEHLGPAHVLVRRVLVAELQLPEGAVRFISPLRDRGRIAVGTALYTPEILRRLLSWPLADLRPDLGIVLVDGDGVPSRKSELEGATDRVILPRIIAVAIQEFEAWLVADERALTAVLAMTIPTQPDPEGMKVRQAKQALADWILQRELNNRDVRMSLAATCDLDAVARRCPAFQRFRSEIAKVEISAKPAG